MKKSSLTFFNQDGGEVRTFGNEKCTDQVVGSDDVAASDNIGVLSGTHG